MKTTDRSTDSTDRRISRMVRAESKPVARDDWFVRKTMNRLPPRQKRVFGLPERIAIVAVALGLGLVLRHEVVALTSCPDPLAYNFTVLLTSLAITVLLAVYVVATVVASQLR